MIAAWAGVDLREVDPEVGLGRRLHAVALVAVVVLVQVGGDDLSACPASPGKAWVRRIDWMISLSLRSAVRFGSWTSSGSRRRARTSCWVIVEAPRLLPRSQSSAAETIATGSKPALSQKVLSSTAVVASTRTVGISSKVTTSRCDVAEPRQLDLARPVVDDRLLRRGTSCRASRGSARPLRQRGVDADRRRARR